MDKKKAKKMLNEFEKNLISLPELIKHHEDMLNSREAIKILGVETCITVKNILGYLIQLRDISQGKQPDNSEVTVELDDLINRMVKNLVAQCLSRYDYEYVSIRASIIFYLLLLRDKKENKEDNYEIM